MYDCDKHERKYFIAIGDQIHELTTLSFWRRSRCKNPIWAIYCRSWEKKWIKLPPKKWPYVFHFRPFTEVNFGFTVQRFFWVLFRWGHRHWHRRAALLPWGRAAKNSEKTEKVWTWKTTKKDEKENEKGERKEETQKTQEKGDVKVKLLLLIFLFLESPEEKTKKVLKLV